MTVNERKATAVDILMGNAGVSVDTFLVKFLPHPPKPWEMIKNGGKCSGDVYVTKLTPKRPPIRLKTIKKTHFWLKNDENCIFGPE